MSQLRCLLTSDETKYGPASTTPAAATSAAATVAASSDNLGPREENEVKPN